MDRDRPIALVTGGSRGIGEAIALRLADDGYDLAINYIEQPDRDNAAEADAVAEQVRDAGCEAVCVAADVTDREAVTDMIAYVTERMGTVDILVNNAGIALDRTMRKLPPEDWDRVLAVNLSAAWNYPLPPMARLTGRGWGRVISISSVVALMGNFGQTNYAASKAGLIGLTKSLAREVARKGVTVNAVAPGFIATEMTGAIPDDVARQIVEGIPMQAMGDPEDVANAVAFLASDDARYITGHVLSVNGGLYM